MNQVRLWLETHVPAVFQHREKTERVDIAGVNLTLRDWEGSTVLAIVPKEILDDEYGLEDIKFRPGDIMDVPRIANHVRTNAPTLEICASGYPPESPDTKLSRYSLAITPAVDTAGTLPSSR